MVNTVTPAARPFVIVSIMLATFMAAIEGTIVATAMPSIVGQLGGFTYYSWVFSAFLLAQSTTTVIYGKLADLFGRKPTLIVGIVLLLLGSLLCGFAWSMTSLVLFRLLQGLGAGAIFPVTITVIGDLYKLEDRGRAQGMMASVWGMALIGLTTVLPIYVQGVLGGSPLVGGFTLSALIIGWPLAVMLSGRLYRTFGIRRTLRGGCVLFPVGAVFLLFLGPQSSPVVAAVGSFLMGCGMGLLSITSIATVQDSVEWAKRGSATASLIFSRGLGSTIGATAMGALLNIGITHYGTGALATRLHDLLNQPAGLTQLSSDPAVRAVFDQALRWSLVGVVVMAGLTFVATWLIPVTARTASAAPSGVEAASH